MLQDAAMTFSTDELLHSASSAADNSASGDNADAIDDNDAVGRATAAETVHGATDSAADKDTQDAAKLDSTTDTNDELSAANAVDTDAGTTDAIVEPNVDSTAETDTREATVEDLTVANDSQAANSDADSDATVVIATAAEAVDDVVECVKMVL